MVLTSLVARLWTFSKGKASISSLEWGFHTFSMDGHVNYVLKICAQRSYLLKLLYLVNKVCLFSICIPFFMYWLCLEYCMLFHHFLSVTQIELLESFLKRMFHYGYSKKLNVFRSIVAKKSMFLFLRKFSALHIVCTTPCLLSNLVPT